MNLECYEKIRKKILSVTSFILIVGTVACAFLIKWNLNNQYNEALKNYDEGNYELAILQLERLGDFKKSKKYIEESELYIKYNMAKKHLEEGEYEKAENLFEELGSFLQSEKMVKEAKYRRAVDLFENKQYEEARLLFAQIEDYEDSSVYKARCSMYLLENEQQEIYICSKQLLDDNNFEEAKQYFQQIIDYKDSNLLYAKCERMMLAKTISAGMRYALAIDNAGKVKIAYSEQDSGFDFSGWEHLVSISGMGSVIVGLNEDGEVFATAVNSFPYQYDVSDWHDIIQVSAGEQYAVGLTADHKVLSFGRYEDGQRKVDDWENIVQVDTMHRTTVGLDMEGNLHFAGLNADKLETEYNKNKDAWQDVVYIDAAGGHSQNELGHVIGLKSDHSIVVLGDEFEQSDITIDDLCDYNIKKIACGNYHLIVVTDQNEVAVVGNPGTIDYVGQNKKEKIDTWSGKNINSISASYNFTMMLTENGDVFAAGNEHQGQMEANGWDDIAVSKN